MRPYLVALMLLGLSACGFQLRGVAPQLIELTPIALQSEASELNRLLEDGIRRAGGEISADADVALHISSERISRQTSTLDSRAKAAEFTLIYEVDFQLRHAGGMPASNLRNVQLRRTYQFDNTRIVGKFEEENLLLSQLRQQASGQIVTQLARAKRADLAPDASPVLAP